MKSIIKKITISLLCLCIFISLFSIVRVFAEGDKFEVSDVSIDFKSLGVEAEIVSFDSDELNTAITFHKVGDYVTFKLLIKNISSETYKLKLVSDNSGNSYVDYEYEYDENTELAPNDTAIVLVKTIYKSEVMDLTLRNQNEEFKISFVLEDEDGNISTDDINVNPSTLDNIVLYVNILIISATCLVIIIVKSKKAKKLMVLVLVTAPVIVNAVAPSLVVTFTINSKLYDKVVVTKEVNGEEVLIGIPYNTIPEKPADPDIAGYNFEGWLLNGEPYNFDEEVVGDVSLTAVLTPIEYTIDYDLDGGNVTGNKDKYTVETETFDLVNPTKEGYTFSGWTGSNGDDLQTRVTIEKGTTGDKSYVAHYSANLDTAYTVYHRYKKLDSTFETVEEHLTGATGTVVKPSARSVYGFVDPELQDLEILPSGDASVEYIYNRVEYNLTLLNGEDIDTIFTNTKYPYETEITLTAKNKEHYNFVEWSNGETANPLVFEITSDIEVGPVYEIEEYTVSFDVQGGVDIDSFTKKYNEEVGELPKAVRTNYIFDGWYTDTNYTTEVTPTTKVIGDVTYVAKWRKSIALANISNENVELERNSEELIEITNVEEEYKFTSNNTNIAVIDSNGLITAKAKGTTTITVTGVDSNKTRTINVNVLVTKYYVTWDSKGGSEVDQTLVNVDSVVGELPKTTQDGQIFLGWFTLEDGGEKISSSTIVTGDVTYYAHWSALICKKASTLHTEFCTKTTGGCFAAGYRISGSKNTNLITFGSLPSTGTLTAGYAYDCDVNGDGNYDSETERFYYLRTLEDNAVLISHTNFEGEDGQQIINNFDYDTALEKIPTTTQWSNMSVTFDDRAARLPTYDDLKAACGKSNLTSTGSLDACIYLLENSRFSSETQGNDGVWLKKINDAPYRYHTNTRAVTTNTFVNGVRPAIEVPLDLMDHSYVESPTSTVSFDSKGGSEVDSIEVERGTAVTELPQPTKDGFIFAGWYFDKNYEHKIVFPWYIYYDVTFYARWDTEAVAEVNGESYFSLQEAIDAPGTEKTIILLRDNKANVEITTGQKIILDLNGHTLSNETSDPIIENDGDLTITNGNMATTGATAAINNNSNGTVTINGGSIKSTGTKQAIYNDGGTVRIGGTAYLSTTSSQRPAVANLTGGTLIITGGTIVATRQQAVSNAGTLIIGEQDGTYNKNTPVFQGKTYGITTTENISVYDGIFKGVDGAIDDTSKITNLETNAVAVVDTENIGGTNYNVLYYQINN